MKNILIVEDDSLLARMYKRVFAASGYDVDITEDGEKGFEKIKETKPDIIILDVMMPKINGIDLLRKIKKDPKLSSIKIVMLTNLRVSEEIARALKLGAVGCISKVDHDPIQVVEEIQRLVGKENS